MKWEQIGSWSVAWFFFCQASAKLFLHFFFFYCPFVTLLSVEKAAAVVVPAAVFS